MKKLLLLAVFVVKKFLISIGAMRDPEMDQITRMLSIKLQEILEHEKELGR